MKKMRSSNIEVFRIFLMLVIVIHHFVLYSIEPYCGGGVVDAVKGVSHFGVIAFILISGYFGIKPNLEKFMQMCFQVLFFSVGLYLLTIVLNEKVSFSFKELAQNSMIFTNRHSYWFIVVYLELFLLSPLLNCAVENLSKKVFVYILGVFAFFVFYMSFFRHSPYSLEGKDIVNFSMIYLFGGFLRKYNEMLRFSGKIKVLLVAILILLVVICGCVILLPKSLSVWVYSIFYNYNSPGVVILAFLFFVLFFSSKVKNSVLLNKIAASVFAVYLLHENVYLHSFIYGDAFFREIITENNILALFVWMAVKIVLVFFAAFLLDWIRNWLYSLVKKFFNDKSFGCNTGL